MSFKTWDEFKDLLYRMSCEEIADKRSATLISPAIYEVHTKRSNTNVLRWARWCAIDVDDYTTNGEFSPESLTEKYSQWKFICYSTASSTREHPKFRMVFPLTVPLVNDKIASFWWAINSEFGFMADRQCKDLSRMYYIPAHYADAYSFIFHHDEGSEIDPYALIDKHPIPAHRLTGNRSSFIDRLPSEMQIEVLRQRKSLLSSETTKTFKWTSYKDCPFVNHGLLNEYFSIMNRDGSGRYAFIYRIMVSIAMNAIRSQYPITPDEIEALIRDLDQDTIGRYHKRSLLVEANRAISYAYRQV